MNQLILDESIIHDEILDFLDENEVDLVPMNIKDYNSVLEKIETLRSSYRRKHKELQTNYKDYDQKYSKLSLSMFEEMKNYIHRINDKKRKLQTHDDEQKMAEIQTIDRMLKFQVDEMERMMKDIYTTIDY